MIASFPEWSRLSSAFRHQDRLGVFASGAAVACSGSGGVGGLKGPITDLGAIGSALELRNLPKLSSILVRTLSARIEFMFTSIGL